MDYVEKIKQNYSGAWNGVSFDPEKRIERFCQDFTSEQDKIKELCLKYEVESNRFLEKHFNLSCNYLSSQSNCISSAISGPANFPIARMEKRSNWAFNHLDKLCDFIQNFEKLLKRITRKNESQDDKKAKWIVKVAVLKKKQDLMKAINVIIKKNKDRDSQIKAIIALGSTESQALEITNPNQFAGAGYPSFTLRNNLANIKRLEEQILQIDKARELKTSFEVNGVKIEFDEVEIRYNIFFDTIPSEAIRSKIKRLGFKWSPTRKAWTRGAKNINQNRLKTELESIL